MDDARRPDSLECAAAALALAVLASCGEPRADAPGTVRLIEHFAPSSVRGSPENLADAAPSVAWRFEAASAASDGESSAPAWSVVEGVEELAVRDGKLCGTTRGATHLLALALPAERDG